MDQGQSCQKHCVNMCGVAKHGEDTPGGADWAPTPANVVALQNEQMVYGQMTTTGIL